MTSPEPHCPICEHRETGTVHVVGGRDLLICCACRHVFWREMPTDAQLHAYYDREYTAAHNQLAQQEANTEYYRNHVEELAGLIRRPKEALLFGDVGCSYPIFLLQAAAAGVSLALGVDWSPEAQDYGLRRGVPVMRPDQFTAQVPDGALDLLRYSHTLEHLIDPVATLEAHLLKLVPGGLLYVTQPCIPVLRLGASPAPPHDAAWPNHLHFFSALSMLTLMQRVGVEVDRFFTVTDETAAQSRYGDALDLDYARATLVSLADKGEASRGPLNNFPFFAGQNLAVYARRTQEGTASVGQTAAGERAALISGIQRDVIGGMAELLAKPAETAPTASGEAVLGLHMERLRERFGRLDLVTDSPVARDSPDHQVPWGTAQDNSTNLRFNARLLPLLPIERMSLLDLGCSGGGQVRSFIEQGLLAVGIEGSDYSCRRLRAEWLTIPEFLFTADITRPFLVQRASGDVFRFGVVTLWEVIEHIKEADLPMLFRNIDAHLLPGGLVIMSVSPHSDVIEGTELHQTIRPREWWVETLATLGWENNLEIIEHFHGDFVRDERNAPNSFHLALSRRGAPPVLAPRYRHLLRGATIKIGGEKL
jgi:2-polyprenyl-3-methyl-5-hydroxy-6-metoxy-1,4-benzoquinol methylase